MVDAWVYLQFNSTLEVGDAWELFQNPSGNSSGDCNNLIPIYDINVQLSSNIYVLKDVSATIAHRVAVEAAKTTP